MDDVKRWPEQLRFGKYSEVFAENQIDIEIPPKLSEDDLEVFRGS